MSTCDWCGKILKVFEVKMAFPESFAVQAKLANRETSLSFKGAVLCIDCFQKKLERDRKEASDESR